MDKHILALHVKRSYNDLQGFMKTHTVQKVTQCLMQCIQNCDPRAAELLEAILSGYPPDTFQGSQGRLSVYKVCIELLSTADISPKMVAEIVGMLLLHADNLAEEALVEAIHGILGVIQCGDVGISRCHPILSKMLSAVGKLSKVTVAGADLTGAVFKDQLINSICSAKWDPKVVLHLVAMFREVSLSDSELLFVLDKVMRTLDGLNEPHEIPPLVSQALLLACKGHRRFVLERICGFFGLKDRQVCSLETDDDSEISTVADTVSQMRNAQGTALLHLIFAVKQDQDMGKEFLKYLKSSLLMSGAARTLHPFVLSVAMAMAGVSRFEDQVTDTLKSAILKNYRSQSVAFSSHWASDSANQLEDAKEGRKDDEEDVDLLANTFVRTIDYSASGGWDAVVPGFVHLGFALMDAYGPKSSSASAALVRALSQMTPSVRSCTLGATILLTTFKAHEIARPSVLDNILNHVVMQSANPLSHFLDLLSDAIKAVPQAVLDCLPRVGEALEYLTLLPYVTAERLLLAVQPLLKVSASLRDATLITLRKAMFGRSVEARKIAVTGFLMLLKNFKVMGSLPSSQTQAFSIALSQISVRGPNEPARAKAFCLEVLGTLRRSLTLQAEVRLCLYEGLYSVLSSNTQLCEPILELLLSHLTPYIGLLASSGAVSSGAASTAAGTRRMPLKLNTCIAQQGDQVFLSEPLSHLVSCIARCGLKTRDIIRSRGEEDEDDEDSASRSILRLQEMFSSLSDSLAASNAEDFELDQAADFSPSTSVGVTNSIKALLAVGTYEGVMEYQLSIGKHRQAECRRVLCLFEKHQALSCMLLEKSSGAAGMSKGGAKAVKALSTLFTLSFLSETVHSMLTLPHNSSASLAADKDGLRLLQDDKGFVFFTLRALLAKMLQVREKGTCDGFDGKSRDKIFKAVCLTGEVLLSYCCKLCTADAEDIPETALPTLECLTTVFDIVAEQYSSQTADFLNATGKDDFSAKGASVSDKQIKFHLEAFQKCLEGVLSRDGGLVGANSKMAILLVELLGRTSRWLRSQHSAVLKEAYDWTHALCAQTAPDDGSGGDVGKAMVGLLLDLASMHKSLPTTCRALAQDIHFILGDVEQEIEVETSHSYACVSERNAAAVTQLLLSHVDSDLEAIDWLLEQLLARLLPTSSLGSGSCSVTSSLSDDCSSVQDSGQKLIINRLGVLILGLYDLIQTAAPFGPVSEAIIKSQSKLFDVLTNLMKYFLQLYARRSAASACCIPSRLEKLVKLIGKQLTPYVYSLITYLQAMQNEHLKRVADKKGGKKKSKAIATLGKTQVRKESKSIPNLIFAIEQYERYLAQLAKKSKVNLMDYVKVSTSRDFRINPASLQAALEQQEEDEGEERETLLAVGTDKNESLHSPNAKENEPPAKKKAKKGNAKGADTSMASTSSKQSTSLSKTKRKSRLAITTSRAATSSSAK